MNVMLFGENTMKITELDEGILDWLKADKQADMQKDVMPMVKQLLDQGMPEDEVIIKVEQELGVRPRYIKQAIQMVRAGLSETATAGGTSAGAIASVANPPAANAKIKKDKNGVPKAPQVKNPDGTAKNAQDVNLNLMGGKTIKR